MKNKQNLGIFGLISITISLLIYFHIDELERLTLRTNLKWISYQQQEFAKIESGKCASKSKVFVQLQDLNEIDRCFVCLLMNI